MKASIVDKIVDDKGNEVSVEYIQDCYYENAQLIRWLSDIELGILHFNRDEYLSLPMSFLIAQRIWKSVKAEIEQQQRLDYKKDKWLNK